MRKKSVFFILFLTLFLGFFVSIPYREIVSATYSKYVQTFEAQVPNNDFSITLDPNHFMESKQMTGTYKVSSASKRSGLLSFRCASSSSGYWNFTGSMYTQSSYLTYFKTYFYCGGNTAHTKLLYFYNNTLGKNKAIIRYYMYYTSGSYRFGHYEAGSYVEDNTGAVDYTNNWAYSFSWNITQSNGLTIYTCPTGTKTAYANNSTAVSLQYRIDRFYMTAGVTDMYFDDWNFTISSAYGGGASSEMYCGADVESYEMQIGDIYNTYLAYDVDGEDIIGDYNVPLDTTIRGVGLVVSGDQYQDDPDETHYTLQINSIGQGSATCFNDFEDSYISGAKLLYWDITVTLDNEILSYVFTHSQAGSGGRYWSVGAGITSYDMDGDGDAIFYFNAESTVWSWEWVYIGVGIWLPIYRPHTNINTMYQSDMAVTFWCDSPTVPEPDVDYENTLGLHNWIYRNETGYVYTMPEVLTTGIVCSYTLEDRINDYAIWVNFSNSTAIIDPYYFGEFPTDILPYPDGTFSGIPTLEGTYKFQLMISGGGGWSPIFNITAYVTGGDASEITDYYLYTDPPITDQFDLYDVVYKYDNPNSYTGSIAFFDDYDAYLRDGYDAKGFAWEIEDASTGTERYRSIGTENEYWGLYANKNGEYVQVFPLVTHLLRMSGITQNKIWTNVESVPYDPNGNAGILFYWTHRFIGTDIAIYVDDIYFYHVGNDQSGNKWYYPTTAGYHVASLQVTQNGSLLEVANCSFTVSVDGGGGGGGGGGVLPSIAQPLGSIVGMIITIFTLLIPFIIGASIHLNTSIHPVIYAFTGGMGLAISTILGLFPVWIPLFVVVCGIIVIVIFYVKGSGVSSE